MATHTRRKGTLLPLFRAQFATQLLPVILIHLVLIALIIVCVFAWESLGFPFEPFLRNIAALSLMAAFLSILTHAAVNPAHAPQFATSGAPRWQITVSSWIGDISILLLSLFVWAGCHFLGSALPFFSTGLTPFEPAYILPAIFSLLLSSASVRFLFSNGREIPHPISPALLPIGIFLLIYVPQTLVYVEPTLTGSEMWGIPGWILPIVTLIAVPTAFWMNTTTPIQAQRL
ncbi:MAG: hypothetical protein Q4C87_05505 [Actinomycetaceae bacterium]|nr:hypothetical protein [Actinomycetaceae bacterium]